MDKSLKQHIFNEKDYKVEILRKFFQINCFFFQTFARFKNFLNLGFEFHQNICAESSFVPVLSDFYQSKIHQLVKSALK